MGMRSQLYIRYKNGKKMVAMHLQWNYGYYMINRTYQLLEYLNKNVRDCGYSNFKEEHFDTMNFSDEDIKILHSLIQMNLTIGSFVNGHDLIEDMYKYNQRQEKFILDPKEMDNNNGILVIDIKEDGKIKYGLACGYEDIGNGNFDMITAKEYFDVSQDNCSDEYKLINTNKELYDKVLKQVEYIDNNFELLTQDEYDEIFKKEYSYEDCLRKEVLNNENERI